MVVLLLGLIVFCFVPPETLARVPDLCLWRNLLPSPACPGCGSTRALAAFFHGQFSEALAFNRNVTITAPGLLAVLAVDAVQVFRKIRSAAPSNLNSPPELNRVTKA